MAFPPSPQTTQGHRAGRRGQQARGDRADPHTGCGWGERLSFSWLEGCSVRFCRNTGYNRPVGLMFPHDPLLCELDEMTLDETTMERLAFNKYLIDRASEQAQEPQPMAATAVLSFHDAVELFLQHAAEYLNANRAGSSQVRFMEYWEIISNELPDDQELGQKTAMRRLNSARVSLKHQGTRPDTADIESFSVAVKDFFDENVPKVFGIGHSDISLINLVGYDSIREKLKQSQEHLINGERKEAIKKLALAYDNLFFEYNQRMSEEFGYQPFSIGDSVGVGPSKMDIRREFGKDMGRFFERVNSSINAVEEAIQVLSLGMDYRRYSKFDALTPTVLRTMGGGAEVPDLPQDKKFSDGDVEFCLDFVVETAIQLQKMDVLEAE